MRTSRVLSIAVAGALFSACGGKDPGGGDGSTDTDTGAHAECDAQHCASNEWCDWGANGCGEGFGPGVCRPRPDEGCAEIYQPVCGCDGTVYGNDCEAQQAGVDVDAAGACDPPGGLFPCGWQFCDPGSTYCQVGHSDIGGEPSAYNCLPLPGACAGAPSCDCLVDEPCADFGCEGDETGLQIDCPGG